jgi:hypothetical protein
MNRFIRIAGTVLLALAMSSAMSGAWAQAGKGNGRGDRNPDDRQSSPRQPDANRNRHHELSKEEREQLRRDIRNHGHDVYRDRDRSRGGEGNRRPGRANRSPR